MIPVAINAGKKALRKRKAAASKQRNDIDDGINTPNVNDVENIID